MTALQKLIPLLFLSVSACKFSELPPVDVDAFDGDIDAADDGGGIDAPVDAPQQPAFDVAYPTEWRMSVAGPAQGFILVVNRSQSPLVLTTFQVSAVSDDHPTAVARITSPTISNISLPPGDAGGMLTPLAEQLLVGSGLVPETWSERNTNLVELELINAPAGTYDINVTLSVSLDGREASLPFVIHHVPGPTVYLDPLVGRRVTAFR